MALAPIRYKFLDVDNGPAVGFRVHVNLTNSSTPATIYATSNPLSVLGSNELICDAAGAIECYVDDSVLYSLICYYPVGNIVHARANDVDPLESYAVVLYGNGEADLLDSKDIVTAQFRAMDAFTGAAVGDAITSTRILNIGVDPAVQIGDTLWFNDTTQTDIATIDLAKIEPVADTAFKVFTATLTSGQSLSSAIDLANYRLTSIVMPASVGTTTTLTFAGCHTLAGTYVTISDEFGQEYRLNNILASGSRSLNLEVFAGYRFVKLRRGTTAAPNTEAVEHVYTLGASA